jgi:secreted trypsin-like serine protease
MPRLKRAQIRAVLSALIVLLLVPAAGAQAASPAMVPRIVGGVESSITESPWQVLLYINSAYECGGSLISSTWVLTAAHCVEGATSPDKVQVFAGITNTNQASPANRLQAIAVIVNPNYNAKAFSNDLALIQLAVPFTPSAERQAITLPVNQDPASWPAAGTAAVVTGWGAQVSDGPSSSSLRRANVHILSDPGGTCGSYGSSFIPVSHVCAGEIAGGVDTCQGDSGGPLVVTVNGAAVLAGVTSVGSECALPNYPGVYTRVTTAVPWIRQYVQIPVTAPLPPNTISAAAIAGARAVVTWTASPESGGSDVTAYTVTSNAGNLTCTNSGTACMVEGLTAGGTYTFTVQATNAVGVGAVSAPTAPVVAVDGTTSVGRTVKTVRVLKWAGVPRSAGAKLTAITKAVCRVTSSGVLMKKAGVCSVRARSAGSRGVAFIAVS